MNSHLNEKQLSEAVLGLAEESEREHLAECEQCRAQLATETAAFSRFGQAARGEALRDEDFWARQRLVISRRIEQKAQHRALRVVWGAAAATAAVMVIWVVMGQSPSPPVPPPVSDNHDEMLLMQVAAALERGAPQAFAPAEVLTHELNRRTTRKVNASSEAKKKLEAKPQ